jgi:hypothetical protein
VRGEGRSTMSTCGHMVGWPTVTCIHSSTAAARAVRLMALLVTQLGVSIRQRRRKQCGLVHASRRRTSSMTAMARRQICSSCTARPAWASSAGLSSAPSCRSVGGFVFLPKILRLHT